MGILFAHFLNTSQLYIADNIVCSVLKISLISRDIYPLVAEGKGESNMVSNDIKDLAVDASKKQYDEVIAKIRTEAEKGSFSYRFTGLSDGVRHLLDKNGFRVRVDERTKEYLISVHY